ncbi:MAG: 2-oxoacid:acceptor oxidoreductase subunit alpha [Candidatus Aminicenantes bacterium]|nr:2-oxoacid:acceptor oxidoreductase subunit alpha [Candidatus Aminicenantes bacterium]MDH5386196.1 2-oxoacid:acceptor oxidoreductase subunit alpha [Candidatus Aminicenantes bacterium]MDH5743293.1 2-oxoacid:acceptor oxidoreductase subunit alpha [Candidatus Aminicenantes bacterium]
MITDISILIAGKAGDGVLFTGNVLAKILKRQGWEIVTYRYFPSNIRGEPTSYTVRASLEKIHGRGDKIDVLMAFDCDAILEHIGALAASGIVLCEGRELVRLKSRDRKRKTFHAFPMRELAREKFGNEIYKNMILLGGLCYILDLDFQIITEIINKIFLKKKGKDVVQKNVQAIHLGCEEAKKIVQRGERHLLKSKGDLSRLLISGDEAIAFGALVAGCRFFAAYPICPATEIWQWLANYFPRFNGLVVQTEDELAAINMALGASYAGVRAMTSTSGPGASLMMEGFGLAGMAEIPIVMVDVQRVGPSTGMPTKSEQADMTQWIHGSHGDFPRIVLSPGTIQECFEFTIKAFNLADKYQCPVILLTEQDYGQNYRTVNKFSFSRVDIDRGKIMTQKELLRLKDYKRYQFTREGISPRALPSMRNGIHMVESNEHDERGYRDESSKNREKMMEKRMKKLKAARKDLIRPKIWGKSTADIGIIGCGSTFGPIQEAMEQLHYSGIETKYLQIRTLWPFLGTEVEDFIANCKQVFVVDNNYEGQLAYLIKSQMKQKKEIRHILNYSGHTFRPKDISGFIHKAL